MKVTEQDFYMDGYLEANLNLAKKMVKKDFDFLMVVDGYEGSGKSVLAQQIGFFLDPSLSLDRICFTPEEFTRAVIDAKPETCVIQDEAFGSLSSRQTLSMVNKTITSLLMQIRQKRLFIIIVLPSVFELDKYVAIHRSRALINVYLDGLQRGQFAFYNQNKKRKLLLVGRKTYNYHATKPDFLGAFTNHYTVDQQAYRKKKLESLEALKELDKGKTRDEKREIIASLLRIIHDKLELNPREIHDLWKEYYPDCLSVRHIYRYVKNDF